MDNVRTDLAIEVAQMFKEEMNQNLNGVTIEKKLDEGSEITIVKVVNEEGAKSIGKPIGNYITIEIPEYTVYDGELMNDVSESLGRTLKKLLNVNKEDKILVVGLGNSKVTPDALGPLVVEKIMVTRHLSSVMPDAIDDEVISVGAIAPGVLGVTGIETFEIVDSLVKKIKPTLVICIDALGSRKTQRVNKTIQICDTGISPGAGVGNHRMKLNKETLGVKVVGIGVPTVVNAATIASDTIDLVLDSLISNSKEGSDFYKMLKNIDKNERNILINDVLDPFVSELVVTPKEIDLMIEALSKIIANGINIAVQPSMTMDEINKFLN